MLTAEQINEMVESVKPAIIESLKQEIASGIDWELKRAISDEIRKYVLEWLRENVLPELGAQLAMGKQSLITQSANIAPQVMEVLQVNLVKHLEEKMSKSWDRKKILSAALGLD
jgi:hypothetical protein